jgi:hypothetical protein
MVITYNGMLAAELGRLLAEELAQQPERGVRRAGRAADR